jgi:hypothetical protein
MTRIQALAFPVVLLALVSGVCGAQTATPHFTIAASNVTMPSSGTGTIPFTLTSVDGFAGSVIVECADPTVAAGVQIPNCANVPVPAPIVLSAKGTATGSASLNAIEYVNETKDAGGPKVRGDGGPVSWAFAGGLLLALGFRRRRRLSGVLLAVGMMVGLTAMSGCAGPATLTPGVYAYTLNAFETGVNNPVPGVSITVQVTVPAGIVIQKVNGPPPV